MNAHMSACVGSTGVPAWSHLSSSDAPQVSPGLGSGSVRTAGSCPTHLPEHHPLAAASCGSAEGRLPSSPVQGHTQLDGGPWGGEAATRLSLCQGQATV